jgi:hypothetical protein
MLSGQFPVTLATSVTLCEIPLSTSAVFQLITPPLLKHAAPEQEL